jgi:hypothetical protein
VFCKKSVEVIENKRWERKKERKERKRVRKLLKIRGLDWELQEGSASFVGSNGERIGVRCWIASGGVPVIGSGGLCSLPRAAARLE